MTIDDRSLDQRLAALPRQSEPNEQTWSTIEARLKSRRTGWTGRLAAGLAVAASLALVVLVSRTPDTQPIDFGAQVVQAEIAAMQHQVSWTDVPASDTVNAGLVSAWEENQQAIEELESALARNPDNLMLMEFLAQARLRQSELVHHATADRAVTETWSL
jgi:hypothetical protein